MTTVAIVLTAIILLLSIYAVYELFEHKVKSYPVYDLKTGVGLTLCVITDLHNNALTERDIERIRAEQPDGIMLSGDIINHSENGCDKALKAIKELCSICDTAYSFGNHELKQIRDNEKEFNAFLKKLPKNCYVLDDKSVVSEELNIYGLKLSLDFYRRWHLLPEEELPRETTDKMPEKLSNHKFSVVLSHTAEYADLIINKYSPDLIISGHLHGGHIRLPFIGGIVYTAFPFPKYPSGLYKNGNTHIFVSRGAGTHFLPLRFLNRAEIAFIKI